jgi:hypothetical protein
MVNGPSGCKAPVVGTRSGAKGGTLPSGVQLGKSTDLVASTRLKLAEAGAHLVAVGCQADRGKKQRIPLSRVAKIVRASHIAVDLPDEGALAGAHSSEGSCIEMEVVPGEEAPKPRERW